MNWQLQTAKSKFSQVVNQALEEGPQIVTRHGKAVVVIVSMDEYQKMIDPQPSLLELLLNSPLSDSGLEIQRDKEDYGREFVL
jgi:prevent-host-death family protein